MAKHTDEQIQALSDAVWQMLDDMGKDGYACCGYAKAQARVAYEPFRVAESAEPGEELVCDLSFEDAKRIVDDCDAGR